MVYVSLTRELDLETYHLYNNVQTNSDVSTKILFHD